MVQGRLRPSLFRTIWIALTIISIGILMSACIRESHSGTWMSGRTVRLNVSNIQKVDNIKYSIDGTHYAIEPTNPNNDLIVARILLWNDRASFLSVLIDEKAAALEDLQYNGFPAINPYEQRRVVESESGDGNRYLPFIWGKVEMPQSYELDGWMIFEVPKQTKVMRLFWQQPETIRIPVQID